MALQFLPYFSSQFDNNNRNNYIIIGCQLNLQLKLYGRLHFLGMNVKIMNPKNGKYRDLDMTIIVYL